jgi:hypothetical protein
VLRRVPRTLERSGYADDPICVTGLYLLAQSLQHSGGQLLQPLIREVAAEQDQSASTTFLIGLADPSSVGAARPFSATGPSDLALAVLANAASSSLAAQIFPQLSRTDADARLVRAACSESLDGGDDLDAMMLLAALEIAIASEEGAGVEEAAATTTSVVHVDVAVLVALKEEFRELHPWLGGNVQLVEEDGQTYYLFRAPGPGGPYQGVALFMGDMGPTAAAIISTKMMNRWQPATVALIGIAAGMHRDVGLGDVVVATQIDAYIERAKAVDEAETFVLNTAGEVYRADRAILGRVENAPGAFRLWSEKGFESTSCPLACMCPRSRPSARAISPPAPLWAPPRTSATGSSDATGGTWRSKWNPAASSWPPTTRSRDHERSSCAAFRTSVTRARATSMESGPAASGGGP